MNKGMTKGLIRSLLPALALLLPAAALAEGEIFRVVDENGNVIFTDQRPSADAQPMQLPELSVIKTDPPPVAPNPSAGESGTEDQAMTPREMRRQFRDFRIMQPQPEETFWGTENQVTVSWGSDNEIPPEMSARLFVNGQPQDAPASGSTTLTLERGEHQVYVELLDARKRRIVATETVTFFVKQHSALFNPGG